MSFNLLKRIELELSRYYLGIINLLFCPTTFHSVEANLTTLRGGFLLDFELLFVDLVPYY